MYIKKKRLIIISTEQGFHATNACEFAAYASHSSCFAVHVNESVSLHWKLINLLLSFVLEQIARIRIESARRIYVKF
jgi:hypothetical protein